MKPIPFDIKQAMLPKITHTQSPKENISILPELDSVKRKLLDAIEPSPPLINISQTDRNTEELQ